MRPPERLQLSRVQQTVGVLESVVLRCFGPDGGQALFTRDSGRVLLSRSGTCILTSLHLEHPLARTVVDCVWKHNQTTGDGSKSFVLLLASLLRLIPAAVVTAPGACQSDDSSGAAQTASASRFADRLLSFAMGQLDDLVRTDVATRGRCVSWDDSTSAGTNVCVQKLLASFLRTRLSHEHCDLISELACQLLTRFDFRNSFQFLNDSFPALHSAVSGFSVSSSRLLQGQVIHRDFATAAPPNRPVKVVVVTDDLQPRALGAGDVLQLEPGAAAEGRLLRLRALMERSLQGVFSSLQTLGVSVLLSSVKQPAAVLAAATRAGLSVVECVSEDELCVFARLSGTAPVSDWRRIHKHHVASLAFCRPIQLGAHRYIHVDFPASEEGIQPCSLVLCAPGDGQTEQHARAFQDAIRMLRVTWERRYETANTASESAQNSHQQRSSQTETLTQSTVYGCSGTPPQHELAAGCLIPAGGTFEFLLSRALLKQGDHRSVGKDKKIDLDVSQLLAKALLSIPHQIYSHNRRKYLETQARVQSLVSAHFLPSDLVPDEERNAGFRQNEGPLEPSSSYRRTGEVSRDVLWDLGLESVSCKSQLLLAVFQCLRLLLRVDTMLHTHTELHTQPRRLGRPSWEDTDDEDETVNTG